MSTFSAKEPDSAVLQAIDRYLKQNMGDPEDTVAAQPYGYPDFPEPDLGFSEYVSLLLNESGISSSEFYKRANLSRQLFNTLTKHKDYRPSRTTVFACALALHLSLEQAKALLLSAGYAFSRSNRTDIIVQYFLEQEQYDIDRVNDVLYYYDLQPLGSM